MWTIGYGSTIPTVHPGDVITQEEADARLMADMADAVKAVNSLVKVPLTQEQFDALVDFTSNQSTTPTLYQVAVPIGTDISTISVSVSVLLIGIAPGRAAPIGFSQALSAAVYEIYIQ